MHAETPPDMKVKVGRLVLKNPIMTASGTFGYGQEYAPYVDLQRLGAVVVKGLSREPKRGNSPGRIMETPFGMLNAVGLQNVGVKEFIENKLPYLKEHNATVVANIFGETVDDYAYVADKLSNASGIDAIEVNISCPNVKKGGLSFGADPDVAYEVTERVKKSAAVPVFVKLTPNVTDVTVIAKAVESAGADGISLINTLLGMAVNIEKRIPHLQNITGGLSGPAIKPIALRMVWQVVQTVSVPVIGIGGIMNVSDVLEFLIVGAKAVQIGTANFINPSVTMKIIDDLQDFVRKEKIQSINDIIGTLKIHE